MCKYYGYIRVSTETQAEKGGGLDVQEKAIRDYAESKGIQVTRIFKDAGISGTKENRPALDELLIETIKEGDVIIVHNTSRLWRDIFAQATIMKAVQTAKANIYSIDDPEFDIYKFMTDPNNFMISSMMGMLDQWERMTIARKLARGRSAKANKGTKPAGVCPLGYQYSADKKTVEINQDESVIVKRIFTELQKGNSLQKIADALNTEGITTRNGKAWTRGSLHVIAKNRFYIGELEHAGQTIQGKHEPIISKVQFGKAQASLSRRHR